MLIGTSFWGFSQSNYQEIDKQIEEIQNSKATTYKAMNDIIDGMKKDTIQLRYIANQFDKKKNYIAKSYILNMLGTKHRNKSEYQTAIKIHKEALATAKKANNIEFRVFSLNMLGVDYRRLDANRTALDYNQEALALAETVKNPDLGLRRSIAVSHNSMGNIYLLLKQYNLAIEQFKQSMVIETEINNQLGLAINNQNIGYAFQQQDKLDDALSYYQKSLAVNTKMDNMLGKIICNNSIANVYIKQGKPQKAAELLNEYLPKAIEMGDKYYVAFLYTNLGWAQTKLKKFDAAEESLSKGLEIAMNYKFQSALAEAYTHLSELSAEKNDYKKSLAYYKLAEEFDEKISNERTIQYVNDLIIKYESERKNNEIQVLAKQNEIAQLNLTRNRNLWLVALIVTLLLASLLYFLYKQRLNKNDKRILTLEQDLLRIQMNPHFIFNALNSIKLYIINNEQKNAVYYLNKFSKLIRKILEASKVKEISLAEELETMDLYMSIENIRFSNEIQHETKVDPSINLDKIKVPPLVLQPFLENSIWHGLSSKKGEKKIEILVQQPNKDFIEISIEDNGIGRKESAKIKSQKVIHRKSIGISLTKERLENFVKDFKNTFSLTYKDLVDTNENALGTKLTLQLPIN